MKGGDLIGEGGYGCAFSPPLKCRGKPKNPTNLVQKRVGKLTNDFDAYWELVITEKLAKEPLAKNYFILIEEECELDNRQEQDEQDLKHCDAIEGKRLTNFKQLTMAYGGTPLSNTRLNVAKFDIFSFIQHILEGGALLLLSGISHMDLHPENILMDEFNVPRFIDFGMAIVPEKLNSATMDILKRAPNFQYIQEPPELALLWAALAGSLDEDTPGEIVKEKEIFRDIETYFGERNAETEIEIFWSLSKSLQNKDPVAFMKTYWPQYDAWSIGTLCVHLLRQLTYYREFQNNPTYSKNKEVIEKVVKGLLEPSPMKRYDAIEALSVLMNGSSESYVLTDLSSEWLDVRKKQRLSQRNPQTQS